MAKEPLTAWIASKIAFSTPFLAPLAIRFAITSESIDVWNTCPASSNNSLITSALTSVPLWAIAIDPNLLWLKSGWAFSILVSPDVEYLTCPIATFPFKVARLSCEKASVISPIPLCIFISVPLATAIPALSCPLCWSAYNP